VGPDAPLAFSLASPDDVERKIALQLVRKGLELAPALGCGALLIAAGVLGREAQFEVSHDEAWERASAAFREVLPLAAEAGPDPADPDQFKKLSRAIDRILAMTSREVLTVSAAAHRYCGRPRDHDLLGA
jgi:sugar phosphate isomerase/epimerase